MVQNLLRLIFTLVRVLTQIIINQLDGLSKKLILYWVERKLISQEKYLNLKFIQLLRLLVILHQHLVKVVQMEYLWMMRKYFSMRKAII
ncbi:MAG: hypothetical protein CMH89_12200 [Oceanicaulis sp.]|nr:hypothetical protein [Oceanicaulis sp.]